MLHAGLRDLPERHTAQAERQLMRANIWAFSDAHACIQQSLLFRHRLQDLPPRGDPWDKGLTPFRL